MAAARLIRCSSWTGLASRRSQRDIPIRGGRENGGKADSCVNAEDAENAARNQSLTIQAKVSSPTTGRRPRPSRPSTSSLARSQICTAGRPRWQPRPTARPRRDRSGPSRGHLMARLSRAGTEGRSSRRPPTRPGCGCRASRRLARSRVEVRDRVRGRIIARAATAKVGVKAAATARTAGTARTLVTGPAITRPPTALAAASLSRTGPTTSRASLPGPMSHSREARTDHASTPATARRPPTTRARPAIRTGPTSRRRPTR